MKYTTFVPAVRITPGIQKTKKRSLDPSIAAAQEFAKKHLHSIKRRTGESYAAHGIEVAVVLSEGVEDSSLTAVAVLHDILVHPDGISLLEASPLTAQEKNLVREMYELRRLHINSRTKDLDKVVDAFLQDERLLPLRMAHRLNDIRHLDRFRGKLRKQIADETLHMYSAIAGRLGLHAWRHEMEDICFQISYPKMARKVQQQFDQSRAIDQVSLKHTKRFLEKILKKQGIHAEFEERIKTLYSTYRKMVLKQRPFHELTDRLALRILVDDAMDCYKVLALVHAHMHPIPGKLKDYIGSPKENGYQSIHTVVYPLPGVTEQPIEIQIRSREMHARCEFGAASHGEYKNFLYALQTKPARVELFRNLENLRAEASSPKQFEDALRKYFSEDHVAIFDTKNNLYHLRKPATALDFVALSAPHRFSHLKEIFINGRRRPLDTVLHDGDIVDAAYSAKKVLQREWTYLCVHHTTKKKIKELL